MGGFGFNVWDLIDKPSGFDDEEERRKRNALSFGSSDLPEVSDLTMEDPIEEPMMERETIMAPNIVGTADPTMNDLVSRYADWQGRMPNREDYKASTGRKILGGLLGFLTGLGGNVQAGRNVNKRITQGKYLDALEDWQTEGKSLGEVGELAQNVSETRQRRESDVLGYEGTQARVEAQRSGIEQRREAENLRHSDRMKNLTEDSERRKEVARHNRELERIAAENNRIRGIEAGARKTAADAYSRSVEQKGAEGKQPKPLPAHYRQAIMDSIGEMLAVDPYAQRWFTRDPRNRDQIMVKPGVKITDPNDRQRFRTFLERAQARARQRLQIPEEDDVEEYNPLRSEIP